MYNWSHIDEEAMKKEDPEKYRLWRLTQLINCGLDGEKLDREEVKAAWPAIKDDIEPYTRRAIEYLLWGYRILTPPRYQILEQACEVSLSRLPRWF